MSRLEELIQELCPDGVEYKKLGEIATISRGGNLQKKDFCSDGIPCIHYGQIYTRYGLFADKTFTFISQDCAKKQKMAYPHDIVMAVTSENIEDVCKCVAWLGDEAVAVSGHTAIIHHSQNAKYLTYYFHTEMFAVQKRKLVHGTKVMEVTPDTLKAVTIPVPPLEVQSEIVRILDNFMEFTAELTTKLTEELAARKQQYEYYRDKLLTFDVRGGVCDCQWRTLSEIATFTYGYTAKAQDAGDTRFIRITDITEDGGLCPVNGKFIDLTDESTKYLLYKGDILLARTGATYGKTLYVSNDEPAVYSSFLIKIDLDNSLILNRYYWYFSKSSVYWTQIEKYVSKGRQQQFNSGAVGRVVVPIPPLPVQQRIVNVLDNLEAICSDLKIGLPAEIEAWQKQYEFYRDALLTFAATGEIIADKQTNMCNGLIRLCQYVFGYVFVTLPDISDNCDSQRKPVTSSSRIAGEYPYYGASGIVDYVNDYLFNGEFLLVSEDGANLLARSTPIAFSISGKNWVISL